MPYCGCLQAHAHGCDPGGIWGHTRWQKLVLVDWQRDVWKSDEVAVRLAT